MIDESNRLSKIEKRRTIAKILINYWEGFCESEYSQEYSHSFFQYPLKKQYAFQDFEKISDNFRTEIEPYSDALQYYVYLPRIASLCIATPKENYLNIPIDFLRFHVILGAKKSQKLFSWAKKHVERKNSDVLEHIIERLNKELFEGQVPLTKTDITILRELSKSANEYFLLNQSLTYRKSFLAQKIGSRCHPISIYRSLNKMAQLGVLKYSAYFNWSNLGLAPYLTSYNPSNFKFNDVEEQFIPLKISSSEKEEIAVLLIPEKLEDKLNGYIPLIPLTEFQTFWNFTAYNPKKMIFPEALKEIQYEDPEDIIFPDPQGILIDYKKKKKVTFNKWDLDLIYEYSCGMGNKDLVDYFRRKKDVPKLYKTEAHVSERTRYFLQESVIRPYFYVFYVNLHSICYVFGEGSNEQISLLENFLRFMISVRHYFGENEKGQNVLFSIVRMAPEWQFDFHEMMNKLRQKMDFNTLEFGWCSRTNIFRRIYLSQLWDEKEQYWGFPYHTR
ncbi:MAG: hypothetical protein ACFFCZ_15075 [Promethearchaeota archaeon]